VERSENEKFTCLCTREYLTFESLSRHQKTCRQWKDSQTAAEPSVESDDSEQGTFIDAYTLN